MSGISIISNFDVNQSVPIDSRLVATSSTELNAIQYKYAGLKVYQVDINRTFTWNGTSWDVEGSGIYGGSGSLVSDTIVDFGTVSVPFTDRSEELAFASSNPSTSISTKNYLTNGFYRHTTVPATEYTGVEYRHQLKYSIANGSVVDSSYIAFNPKRGGNDTQHGGISFNTGYSTSILSEKMRITYAGKVGIGTTDPKAYLQIATSSDATSAPLVLHNADTAIIGHNWYFSSGSDQFFDVTKASTKIIQSNGSFIVQNRPANAAANGYVPTLFSVGTNGGRVGVRNINPTVALDVTGEILGLTVSSANRIQARSYNFNAFVNNANLPTSTSIFTTQLNINSLAPVLVIRVAGTSSFVSDGNINYVGPRTLFYDKVDISKDLYVAKNTTINENLTVAGTGSITNFEPKINLVPSGVWRADGIGQFNQTPGMTVSLSSFTYSFSFYRVGALVHLNVVVETIANIDNTSVDYFHGFLFKFSNQRFASISSSFGSGTSDNHPSNGRKFYPINIEVFQTDPTPIFDYPNPGNVSSVITVTGADFYVRIRPSRIDDSLSLFSNYISGGDIITGTKFRGTVVYLSGVISTPTPPTFPTVPGDSVSTSGSGPVL